jgi:molybdopterin/thiamine biosynthesis adenylyltransferase/molybdopterin converting factor small subunit
MAVNVYIPTPFRRLTGNRTHIQASGANVAEVLENLDQTYPGFRSLLFNECNEVPAHINIYLNNREIHGLQGTATSVADGDELAVIPAIAGGAQAALTLDQVTRYSRHIIMPQVGPVGQRKLMDAKVLIVGAGGLGSPIALYLAAAGVGTLGLVDFDVVDLSNLQRQLLHQTDDVGKPKVQSARETLNAYNPEVKVVTHEVPLSSENALDILPQYDIIVNGADNFATRYLVNDASYLAGKPLVDGSILLFDGQATTFIPGQGCYRCLFPEPPPPGLVPSCAEAGVLGALCGTIGSIQATEVLKLILGIGEPLVGRLLLYDALAMEMRQVKIRRNPNCPLCGDHPTVTELIDYDAFCGAPTARHDEASVSTAG